MTGEPGIRVRQLQMKGHPRVVKEWKVNEGPGGRCGVMV